MLGLGGGKSRILLIAVICIIIVVAVAAAVLSIPSGSISEGTPSYTLTVRVRDSSSGEGLVGVTATVADVTATVENKTATTGSGGTTTFDLPEGRYEINVQKDGYTSKTQTIDIIGDYLENFDIETITSTATGPTGTTNNTSVTITYNYAGTFDNVKLYYTTDGGTNWNLADTDTSVDGSHAYTAPGAGTYGWIAVAIGGGSTETDPPTGGTSPEAENLVIDLTG